MGRVGRHTRAAAQRAAIGEPQQPWHGNAALADPSESVSRPYIRAGSAATLCSAG